MTARPPHDDDRCARIYRDCKGRSVGFARKLLLTAAGRRNGYLAAFDAEEFYDAAWETYYDRREYLEDRDDHVAYLNALILSRFRDEHRRSAAVKRTPPGEVVAFDDTVAARDNTDRVVDREQLRQLLAQVKNPDDSRALFEHEVLGLTFAEIAAAEGITAEAARRRAERAREQARRSAE